MVNNFSAESSAPDSYKQIKDYLIDEVLSVVTSRPIIFLCIGTDRSTGDSLGPIVGHKLSRLVSNMKGIYIFGTLDKPVHARNISEFITKIKNDFDNPFVISIDACLGKMCNIGKIFIKKGPLYPGAALNKNIEPIGDLNITGVVNLKGEYEFLVLQNTRLNTVINIADKISKGIFQFLLESRRQFPSNVIPFS